MPDQLATLRLMTGLIGTLYLLLQFMTGRRLGFARQTVPATVAAAVIVALWVFSPAVLEAGSFGLPFRIRQLGLLLGGVAVALAYVELRPASEAKLPTIVGRLTTPMLAGGLTLASANWLVAVGLAIVAVIGIFRPVGASAREAPKKPPHQPGDE